MSGCRHDTVRQPKVTDHGPDAHPGHRYYVKVGDFGASSWSPEAAMAEVRRMESFARRAEAGEL